MIDISTVFVIGFSLFVFVAIGFSILVGMGLGGEGNKKDSDRCMEMLRHTRRRNSR